MARRRYQKGTVFVRGKDPKWVGRWLEDVQQDGAVRRIRRSVVLGTLVDVPTKRLALRLLDRGAGPCELSSLPTPPLLYVRGAGD